MNPDKTHGSFALLGITGNRLRSSVVILSEAKDPV